VEDNLRLCIFAQSNHFEEWLRQYVPESGEHFKYKETNGEISIYIKNSSCDVIDEETYSKILGSPKATVSPQGDRQYDIEVCQGSLEDIQIGNGITKRVPFLKIVKIKPGMTEILLDMNQDDIPVYLYLNELARQIAETYPETRRRVYNIHLLTTLAMDRKIFDYKLETEPVDFLNWCNVFLRKTYPGGFFKHTPNEEIIAHIQYEIFPQDTEVTYWEIIFFATEIVFPKNQIPPKPYMLNRGPIASIKATPSGQKEIHATCSCELYNEQVIEWFSNLNSEIKQFFFQKTIEDDQIEIAVNEDSTMASAINQNQTFRTKGPSIDTQQKFYLFKKFKDRDPSLTQLEVANSVNAKLGTAYSARDVGYAYKACGGKWERGS
jgi:hypothetical protein